MNKITKKTATVEALLRKGHINAKGEHPVKIRVTFDRQQKYYPVKLDGKPLYIKPGPEWDELWQVKVRKDRKRSRDAIDKVKATAITARDKTTANGRPFSFERFEKEFIQQESAKGILFMFERYLDRLKKEERIGSYSSYKNAYTAFNNFRGGKSKTKDNPFVRGREIRPEYLTTEVLKEFDAHLKKQGCNKTTIGIYMRALKIIYNVAVDENPSLAEFYPFARKQNDNKRYKIRKGSGKKGEALAIEDLQKFINTAPPEGSPEWEAKQYWLFMFYGQGMNMADVLTLRYQDIQWDAIRYVRKKTQDTEINEEQVVIPLSQNLNEIILSIGNPNKSPDNYVFPILTENMTAEKIHSVKKQKTKIINKWLKRLCDGHDLPAITTYWSRHTYANLLRGLAVSDEMISELLGHGDVKTTRAYMQRFAIDKKKEANEKIEAILKVSQPL